MTVCFASATRLPMRTPIQAVLFDLDGVLLDTEPLYTAATQAVVSRFGRTYTFDIKRRIMGGSAKNGADVVIRELNLPITADEYLAERRTHLERLFQRTVPIEGAEELVRYLSNRGLRLAIATSSERVLFELKSRNHSWFSLFSKVVCGDDPRILAPKPAPYIFRVAAMELGTTADHCLVFEDSPAGVAAGHAAGATVIARRDPALSEQELSLANVIVTRYDELDIDAVLTQHHTDRGPSPTGDRAF